MLDCKICKLEVPESELLLTVRTIVKQGFWHKLFTIHRAQCRRTLASFQLVALISCTKMWLMIHRLVINERVEILIFTFAYALPIPKVVRVSFFFFFVSDFFIYFDVAPEQL